MGSLIFATQVPMMFAILPEGGGGGTPSLDPFVSGTKWYFYRNHYDGDLEPQINEVKATGDNGDGVISVAAYIYSYSRESDSDDVINVRFNTYYRSRLNPTYPLVTNNSHRTFGLNDVITDDDAFVFIHVSTVNSSI